MSVVELITIYKKESKKITTCIITVGVNKKKKKLPPILLFSVFFFQTITQYTQYDYLKTNAVRFCDEHVRFLVRTNKPLDTKRVVENVLREYKKK